MFEKLAKSGLADFTFGRFLHLPCIAQRGPGFSIESHSNDNLPGLRRPKGQRRIPTPALACHWFIRNGRLECRWQAGPDDAAPIGGCGEHGTMDRAFGLSSMQPSGRGLALAG
jgi:hypothetical protein